MSHTALPLPPNTPQPESAIARKLQEKLDEKRREAKGKGKADDDSPDVEEPTTPRASLSPSLSSHSPPPSSSSSSAVNPWLAIIASAADHPAEHLTKLVRALAYAGTLFGHSPPGLNQCALRGSDILDGSVFIRCAGIAMSTMGWAREGGMPASGWDRSVLGYDEAWKEEDKLSV